MIENIPPCSRKRGCFCTFNDFKTFAQLSFPSLPQISTSFSKPCLSKRPFFSRTSFPARKAAIIFCCVLLCAVQDAQCNTGVSPISFPESSFPLTSGSGYERLWDEAFSDNRILVIPVELRRRECVFQDGLLV